MKKLKIVGIRLTEDDVGLIDKAAEVDMRPRSQFILKAAVDKAREMFM